MCSRSHRCKLALRKRGLGFIKRTDLAQNSLAVSPCHFPYFSGSKLKLFPGIFEMDWAAQCVHTFRPNAFGILAKRRQHTAHLSKDFQAANNGRYQGRSNETTSMLKHLKAKFEVCQVPSMLCGTKCQGRLANVPQKYLRQLDSASFVLLKSKSQGNPKQSSNQIFLCASQRSQNKSVQSKNWSSPLFLMTPPVQLRVFVLIPFFRA